MFFQFTVFLALALSPMALGEPEASAEAHYGGYYGRHRGYGHHGHRYGGYKKHGGYSYSRSIPYSNLISPNLYNITGIVCQCNTVLFNPIPTHTLTQSVQNSFQLFTNKKGKIFDKRISIAGLTLPIQCARQFGM